LDRLLGYVDFRKSAREDYLIGNGLEDRLAELQRSPRRAGK
jgi:hypothetical protein